MKSILFVLLSVFALGCSTKSKYDVARYHDLAEQASVLTSIITFIFTAPPYTSMEDRFKAEHRKFYTALTPKFSIQQYFVADDGRHFFYVIRPSPKVDEKRGVGGYFKMDDHFRLTGFREVFVTPIMPEDKVKTQCAFLFDEMVKGDVEKYLTMETYVQWPNSISYYDTTTYEWKMIPEKVH
jgi:hypothetical protein